MRSRLFIQADELKQQFPLPEVFWSASPWMLTYNAEFFYIFVHSHPFCTINTVKIHVCFSSLSQDCDATCFIAFCLQCTEECNVGRTNRGKGMCLLFWSLDLYSSALRRKFGRALCRFKGRQLFVFAAGYSCLQVENQSQRSVPHIEEAGFVFLFDASSVSWLGQYLFENTVWLTIDKEKCNMKHWSVSLFWNDLSSALLIVLAQQFFACPIPFTYLNEENTLTLICVIYHKHSESFRKLV